MKKRIKSSLYLNYLLFAILAALLFSWLLLPKIEDFQKTIPDVVELPKYVRIPILLYHYVEYVKDEKDTIRRSLNIEPYFFETQVKTLKEAGYVFLTTSELADALDDKNNLNPQSVILTFDDGYRDFYTDVFPILKKYQVKAVVYIVPNFLNLPNNLTTWQLKEIAENGLVEIGAHAMDHTYLAGLPLQQVKYEVRQSKKYLENNFGVSVVSFAYPYGAFDNQAIDVVKKAGFKTAVSTLNGIFAQDINRFFLYRIRPGIRTGEELLDFLKNPVL